MDHFDKEMQDLVAKGKSQGYLTYDEVIRYLPDEAVDPDKLDNLLILMDEMGIELLNEAPEPEFFEAPDEQSGEAGQEIELGTNFALTLSFTQHRYDVTDTVYAAFQDVKWGDEPVDFSLCELFNPGSDAPDSDNPDWSRTQTQENCFRIGQYQNGIGTWSHNYQLGQVVDKSWSGRIWAPLWVHFKPRTGRFADDVAYE